MGRAKTSDESGIRTHATEVTGALNQRLGPLGHLAMSYALKLTLLTILAHGLLQHEREGSDHLLYH